MELYFRSPKIGDYYVFEEDGIEKICKLKFIVHNSSDHIVVYLDVEGEKRMRRHEYAPFIHLIGVTYHLIDRKEAIIRGCAL